MEKGRKSWYETSFFGYGAVIRRQFVIIERSFEVIWMLIVTTGYLKGPVEASNREQTEYIIDRGGST